MFAENGRLYQKAGWITIKNKKYYLNSNGKKLTNRWKNGYYLQENGTVAVSKRVPDGSYVDAFGRKCEKNEVVLSALKTAIDNTARRYGGTWSVYVKNLETGDVLNYNDKAMYPASVIKPFVMASTFNQIKKNKLSYDSNVQSLLRQMITISDNEAYNSLVRLNGGGSFLNGTAVVNKYLKAKGYKNTGCHTTLHPAYSSHVSDGGSNITSAKDCGLLLEKIYQGKCVSKKYSQEMLNLLLRQKRRWKIPAGVPSGIKGANKTGETNTYQHDMAIVFGAKTDYVISVFAANAGGWSASGGIVEISRNVYNFLN